MIDVYVLASETTELTYDLIIEKEKDTSKNKWDLMNSALYINSNGKDGAFMYVENTVISSNYVPDTKTPFKFFYNGLKTKNGDSDYTSNDSNVKNQRMEFEDWIWD